MARISTYKFDENVTADDFVIGSDADNFNKTRNYRISEIIKSIQFGAVNNIPKIVSVVLEQGEDIPSAMQEINLEVLPDDSPVFINFLKPTVIDSSVSSELEYRKISYFFPLGNGVYEPISDFVNFQDLILNSVTKPSQSDLSLLQNTQTIDAGDITGQNISEWLNTRVPSLNLSDEEVLYVFTFEDNGVSFFSVFTGQSGVYGLNDTQSTLLDFTQFTNSETLSFEENRNIKGKILNVEPDDDFYEDVENELNEVVSKINLLPTFTITQDEYCIIKAPFKNAQEKEYENLYLITRGKGVYGSGGFQITNTPINILKIEDGFNSQNLSDYVNDSEFITEDDLPEITVPTNVSAFTNDANYVTQTELQNALSFRGIYGSEAQIVSISNPKEGDYALLVSGKTQQKWIRNNSEWLIQSAINFFNQIENNYTVQITDHNATIVALDGANEITLEGTFYNLEFLIFNESGSNVQLLTSGTNIIGSDEIFDGQSAYVSFDKEENVYYVKRSSAELGTRIATYDYVGSNLSLVSQLQGVVFPPDVDGIGAGFKDPLVEIPDVFDAGNRLDFDFSKLKVGDIVKIQVTGKVSVTSSTTLSGDLVFAKGEPNEFSYQMQTSTYPKIGEYGFNKQVEFVVGSIASIINAVELDMVFDEDASIYVNNVYVKIISKS